MSSEHTPDSRSRNLLLRWGGGVLGLYLAISIATYVLLVPAERAVVGRLSTQSAMAQIVSFHLGHLVIASCVTAIALLSIRFYGVTVTVSFADVWRWTAAAHLPFLLWALLGAALTWPLAISLWSSSAKEIGDALPVVQERVRLWETLRAVVWISAAGLLTRLASRQLLTSWPVVAALIVVPVLVLWGVLEAIVRLSVA